MAKKFDGTNDFGSVALNLSAYNKLSVSAWLWWDSYANDYDMALGFGTPGYDAVDGWAVLPNFAGGQFQVAHFDVGIGYNSSAFDRASANAWHHYLFTFDRNGTTGIQHKAFVDGRVVTMTQWDSAAVAGNYANSTLYIMSHASTSLFGAGRMAELAIWPGVILTQAYAATLARGELANTILPERLLFYEPMSFSAASVRAKSNLVPPPLVTYSGAVWETSPVMREDRWAKRAALNTAAAAADDLATKFVRLDDFGALMVSGG